MGSASVFKSLRELFPQVDLRILRALSIEHENDVNEAIEFILSDVLLTASTEPEFSSILHDTSDREQASLEEAIGTENVTIPDGTWDSPLVQLNFVGEAENKGLHSLVANCTEDTVFSPPQLTSVDASEISAQRLEVSDNNNSLSLNISDFSEKGDETMFYNSDNQHYYVKVLSDGGCDNTKLTEDHTKLSNGLEFANIALHADSEEVFQVRDEENISVHFAEQTISSAVYDNSGILMNYRPEKENDINIQLNECDGLSGCSTDACRPLNLIDLETVVDTLPALTSMHSMSTVSGNNQICQSLVAEEHGDVSANQNLASLEEKSLDLSSNKNEDFSILLTSLATRSGHTIDTDLLEDSIMNAKNSKKTLVATLESMVSMMQEVEILEERAKQVTEDTLVANHQILSKVEELQKVVKQYKDELDVNAGEVYGERSILMAEARELQSRIIKMPEERNDSVTEEFFKALEARKTAALDEIAAASFLKTEMEELLEKALKDKQLMMDSMHAESQKLQLVEEENNKLREFLMDRGRFVDSLQGELAIIWEDILSTKQKVDSHTPLTKHLRSSSSWSYGSPGKSPDHRPSNSFDCTRSLSSSSSSTGSLTHKESPEKHQQVENTSVGRNTLDDWELCEE